VSRHVQCTSDSQYTGTSALDWSRRTSAFRVRDRQSNSGPAVYQTE